MKLHTTPTQQYQTVTGYDRDWVELNSIRYQHSLIVMPEMLPVPWAASDFDTLKAEHFAPFEAWAPDVVIIGTGQRQRFVPPSLLVSLIARRIGVESMDNQAACRTYNILMAEGRKVALAVILYDPKTQ